MNSKRNMNNAEKKIGQLTAAMLAGTVHYLEGAQEIIKLRDTLGVYVNDPDFMPFVAILKEIRTLECDTSQANWPETASKNQLIEIERSLVWAKEFSILQCQSLSERYR